MFRSLIVVLAIALLAPRIAAATELGPTYAFTTSVEVFACDENLAPIHPRTIVDAQSGYLFRVIDTTSNPDLVRIWFLPFRKNDTTERELYNEFSELQEAGFARSSGSTLTVGELLSETTDSSLAGQVEDSLHTERLIDLSEEEFNSLPEPVRTAFLDTVHVSGRSPRFCVDRELLDAYSRERNRLGWSGLAGALLVPIKLRFGDGDADTLREFEFDAEVAIAASAGAQFRVSHYEEVYLTFTGFAGISAVQVDTGNARVLQEVAAESEVATSAVQGRTAFSAGFGVGVRYQQLNATVLVGADWLARPSSVGWSHDGIPWLGLSIGTPLYSADRETTVNRSQ